MASAQLRQNHAASIQRMLQLRTATPGVQLAEEEQWSDEWKVLIYDKTGRDIISPLMRIGDLRRQGVTLHTLITDTRDKIPDAPAVYFVRPTSENIAAIARDAAQRQYKSQFIHFTAPTPRPLLQSLAQGVAAANASALVSKVVDRYCDFVSLEDDLFALGTPDCYATLHRPGQAQDAIMQATYGIAEQLLCVCATLGAVPIIQSTTRGPAQAVAQQLAGMLHACVDGGSVSRDSVFGALHPDKISAATGHVVVSRPLLLILDRHVDLGGMLTHPSTYCGFVSDTLGLRANRTSVPEEGGGRLALDLDSRMDAFWKQFAAVPLPEAIEGNDTQLQKVIKEEAALRRKAGGGDGGEQGGAADPTAMLSTQGLSSAMDSLPALLKRKQTLQGHTKLLKAIMDIVASREIPLFYEAEDTPSPALLYPLLGVPQEEVKRVGAAAAAAAKGGGAGSASVNLGTVRRGKGAFIDRVRASAMFLLAADAAPLGNAPPKAAEGGDGGEAGAPAASSAWGATTSAATRAFHEVASILRASAAAHVAESRASAASSGGGGFLSGGFWDSGSSNAQAQVQKADGSVDVPVPPPPSPEQVQEGIAALQHLAEHRALASKVARGGAGGAHAAASARGGASGAASGALWNSLTSQFSKAAEAAVQGVKGLLGVAAHSLLNEIVGAAVDNKAHERLGETAVFDAMGAHPGAMPPGARPRSDGGLITFVVGGGSMSEYHDHQKWAAKRQGRGAGGGAGGRSGPASGGMAGAADGAPGSKYALYGATDMVSAEAFLQQLASLGGGK